MSLHQQEVNPVDTAKLPLLPFYRAWQWLLFQFAYRRVFFFRRTIWINTLDIGGSGNSTRLTVDNAGNMIPSDFMLAINTARSLVAGKAVETACNEFLPSSRSARR